MQRILAGAGGMPVAVLNHNRIMGCLVPAELYEQLMERPDDLELVEVVDARVRSLSRCVWMSYELESCLPP